MSCRITYNHIVDWYIGIVVVVVIVVGVLVHIEIMIIDDKIIIIPFTEKSILTCGEKTGHQTRIAHLVRCWV